MSFFNILILRRVMSRQSHLSVCSRVGPSTSSFTWNVPPAISANIIPVLASAAPLDLSPSAWTELYSMPRPVQNSNKFATSSTIFDLPLAYNCHNLLTLLIDTKKKLLECRNDWKLLEARKYVLDRIWLLEASNLSLRAEWDGLKVVLKKLCLQSPIE